MQVHWDAPLDSRRRQLLLATAAAVQAAVTGLPAWASGRAAAHAQDFWNRPRRLVLRHASGELVDATYWSDGELVAADYLRLCWFLRDRVTDDGVHISPVLLDILYGVHGWLAYFDLKAPIVVTSGYRSADRNRRIEGAARNSLHTTGEAADIRIEGVDALQVARFGRWLGGGGVGWYPGRHFTHLDRGRLRVWRG